MTPALVYDSRARPPCAVHLVDRRYPRARRGRDAVVYANVEAALALAGAAAPDPSRPAPTAIPGYLRIGDDERVLAVGLDAHLALADWQKCTLLAEALDPEPPGASAERLDGDPLDGLLWSCLNTRRAVILGRRTWAAAQLLPFADLRFHATPPLRWGRPHDVLDRDKILIVDHGGMGTTADELRAALAGYARVEVTRGWPVDADRPAGLDAGTHLHVGDHTLGSERLRLVDSWINGVPVLQVRRGPAREVPDEEILRVRQAQNGFACAGVADVLAAFEDLRDDGVLRAKVTEAGIRTVARLAEGWRTIAAELLEG